MATMTHPGTGVRLAVTALMLATITACAGPTLASPPRAAEDIPTATSVPALSDPTARPSQVFSGNCSSLMGGADVADVLETEVDFFEPPFEARQSAHFTESIGGISCLWGESSDSEPFLLISVLPRALVEGEPPFGFECDTYADSRCDFAFDHPDFYVYGLVQLGPGNDKEAAADAVERVEAHFASGAAAAAEFAPADLPVSAWPVAECGDLDNSVDIRAMLDLPSLTATTLPDSGELWELEPYRNPVYEERAAHTMRCGWIPDDPDASGGVRISTLAPAGWIADEIAILPNAIDVDVPAADSASLIESGEGVSLHVFVGPNWLEIRAEESTATESLISLAANIIAYEDASTG
jgi:hypothetical protein